MGTEQVKISKQEADKIAKLKFGMAAFAIRVSSKNRNQRFGIMLVDNNSVFALGYGDSFVSALNMAEIEVREARKTVEEELKLKSDTVEKQKDEVKPEVKSE